MALYKIGGHVLPGYEAVYEAFESNFLKSRESKSQLCVYVKGEKVVDLWGSIDGDTTYNGDSLQPVFSSTKNLSALAIAWCVDQGLLDYEDPLLKHWPELKYKENMKVCDVLRHESGLHKLSKGLTPTDLQRSNIKNNSIGQVIEMELQEFPESSKRCYHTMTRGWILNELFRRVHPDKLTIGEFLRKEFSAEPFKADVHIGFESDSDPSYENIFELDVLGVGSTMFQTCLPTFSKFKRVDLNPIQFITKVNNVRKRIKESNNQEKPEDIILENVGKFSFSDRCLIFNKKELRTGEVPSANGTCSARGLGKIASILASKGSHDGKQFLSKETWTKMHSAPTKEWDALLGFSTRFTLGGVSQFTIEKSKNPDLEIVSKNRDGFYGWMGFGGSVFQWEPEKEIGFAYVPTFLEWYDMLNTKGSVLQKTVVECVEALNKSDSL
ncbi:esterase/beta-lactamase LipL [Lepeophtheirus salmonis]|uniref:esterase/beta-lactamase LipL n=1 Tax=Lepeophtheirus salmonis TaxID=72036 RepID=UPI001AEB6D89|nr:beta-lactamase domain-containing protein 2-like [Lepeophtheirus salmonis]